ncbi:MAG: sigma-70 family RNA polymerase sigma factor [Acidimicrobiia bacterium]|nr:sigma-70 family RNA polymerase sigma factor [Acidimicrobiia bacterium]
MEHAAQERFDSLYQRYSSPVFRYFLRRLCDPDRASDATADLFVVVWRRLAAVPDGEREEPWIYAACGNVLRNHRRERRRRQRLVAKLGSQAQEPAYTLSEAGASADLITAIERLRPADREILLLSAWEELDHATIGRVLGCSTHAVDQRIHRAIARLRMEIDKSQGSTA